MAFSFEETRRQMLEEKARQAQLRAQAGDSAQKRPVVITPDTLIGVIPGTEKTPAPINRPPAAATPAPEARTVSTPPAPAPRATTPPFVAPSPSAMESPRSSPPMSVPAFVRFFKLSITAAILLAGSYFAVKSAYPFVMELARPGSTANSKDAPASVKILQQTRGVVAKNNANVDHLNALIEESVGGNYAATNTLAMPALPPPPPQPKPKAVQPQVRLERLTGIVLDELHVSSVLGGRNPQITINGLIVSLGDIADAKRRLRFVSLDETRRIIVLGNGEETIDKPY